MPFVEAERPPSLLAAAGQTSPTDPVRGADGAAWVGAEEAWTMGTVGGARALGLDDVLGRVEPGFRADLVLLRLDRVGMTPPSTTRSAS